jgi:hypothetical protein
MRTTWTAAVALLLLPVFSFPQSLGSAAQKEKDRRKKNQEAGVKARTVTDEDLAGSQGSGAARKTEPAASAPVTPPPPPPEDHESQRRAARETEWRERMAQARARLDKARKSYDTLSQMSLVSGEAYVDERGRTVVSSVEQLQRLTAEAKAELAAAQKAIDDLEDRARREGVPPGWLR